MEWIRKNLSLIVIAFGIISTGVTAQVQIEANTKSLETLSEAVSGDKKEARESIKELEKSSEKALEELRIEQRRLEIEQQKQTEIRVNQTHIIKGLEAMQESIKELSREIREKK